MRRHDAQRLNRPAIPGDRHDATDGTIRHEADGGRGATILHGAAWRTDACHELEFDPRRGRSPPPVRRAGEHTLRSGGIEDQPLSDFALLPVSARAPTRASKVATRPARQAVAASSITGARMSKPPFPGDSLLASGCSDAHLCNTAPERSAAGRRCKRGCGLCSCCAQSTLSPLQPVHVAAGPRRGARRRLPTPQMAAPACIVNIHPRSWMLEKRSFRR